MPFLLRIILVAAARRGWQISTALIVTLAIIGYPVMGFYEPPESAIPTLGVYWWWFIVTITTVGYGDYSPASSGGRVMATIIMLGGIGSLGLVIAQVSEYFGRIGGNRLNGLGDYSNDAKDHVVIVGYRPATILKIIQEIKADKGWEKVKIVLCYHPDSADETPLADQVLGVKGTLNSADVMHRSGIKKASRILVAGSTDDESLRIILALKQTQTKAHIVVALYNTEDYTDAVHQIDPAIDCAQSGAVAMIVQALQDPGLMRLYSCLLSNAARQTAYRSILPEGFQGCTFGNAFIFLKQSYGATIIGVAENDQAGVIPEANPEWEMPLVEGMALYYIAPGRLQEVRWREIPGYGVSNLATVTS